MNILFLTMSKMTTIEARGIYTDLMRKFRDENHNVYVVSPSERREGKPTRVIDDDNDDDHRGKVHILCVRTLNVQKTNVIEKGLGQVSIEWLYKRAIKKHFAGISFDLILYSTPPITLMGVVKEMKHQNPKAISYLLLKDIFPQNALDIGMMTETGWKGFLYRRFRKQEIELYKESDYVGCMSPANVRYLLEHNAYLDPQKVEVAPNSIELVQENDNQESDNLRISKRNEILKKYGLPIDKPIFIYGGNLGQPQGIPFLIECLDEVKHRDDCHFVVVGTGTYLPKLLEWYESNTNHSNNTNLAVTVMKGLPKDEYDELVRACDVGLIFLDYRFIIPNYPSRLLSYLEYKMPIIACTDPNCDTGSIAEENGYGMYVPSNNKTLFTLAINKMLSSDIKAMGEKGYQFLLDNYLVDNTYQAIIRHFK